ncbi:MAG: hypothetical protein M3Q20_03220 [Actinomycetota bacterium]|nr:hypothetical protein [Actinomycetota bacterium]
MQTTTYTETPGTDDRPEELPENERPEELPQIEEQPQEMPEPEPGNVQPDEVEPLVEPDSPEIGQPPAGPAQSVGQITSVLQAVEDGIVVAHPRRTVGGWRQSLRRRAHREHSREGGQVA